MYQPNIAKLSVTPQCSISLSSVIVFHVSDLYCNGDRLLFIHSLYGSSINSIFRVNYFFPKPYQVSSVFSLVYSFTSSFDNEDDDNNPLKYKRETLIILLVIVIIVFKYYLAINRRKDAIKSSSWNGEGSWTSEKPWLGTSKCGFYTNRVSWVWEQQDSSIYKLCMYDIIKFMMQ